jgi:hypothetical protein
MQLILKGTCHFGIAFGCRRPQLSRDAFDGILESQVLAFLPVLGPSTPFSNLASSFHVPISCSSIASGLFWTMRLYYRVLIASQISGLIQEECFDNEAGTNSDTKALWRLHDAAFYYGQDCAL